MHQLFSAFLANFFRFLSFFSAVTIGFERSMYAVREDAGSVDICLRFRGPLKNDSFVELNITINSNISGGEALPNSILRPFEVLKLF